MYLRPPCAGGERPGPRSAQAAQGGGGPGAGALQGAQGAPAAVGGGGDPGHDRHGQDRAPHRRAGRQGQGGDRRQADHRAQPDRRQAGRQGPDVHAPGRPGHPQGAQAGGAGGHGRAVRRRPGGDQRRTALRLAQQALVASEHARPGPLHRRDAARHPRRVDAQVDQGGRRPRVGDGGAQRARVRCAPVRVPRRRLL
ncbi:MAG: hypothetical protein CL844_03865 [Crocinitomicaceae bacterium]|nr:hypothetical protein [Crocinitomicaceae bacterium]